jgi:hypothetical protein
LQAEVDSVLKEGLEVSADCAADGRAAARSVQGGACSHAFDLVTGVYILNYAKTEAQLEAVARTAACHLKAGGVCEYSLIEVISLAVTRDRTPFELKQKWRPIHSPPTPCAVLGMNSNPFTNIDPALMDGGAAADSCREVGFCRTRGSIIPNWSAVSKDRTQPLQTVPELEIGEPIHYHFVDISVPGGPTRDSFPLPAYGPGTDSGSSGGHGQQATGGGSSQGQQAVQYKTFTFDNFHLPAEMHEAVFKRAGFSSFEWVHCSEALKHLDGIAGKGTLDDGHTQPAGTSKSKVDWAAFCDPRTCPLIGFVAKYEG